MYKCLLILFGVVLFTLSGCEYLSKDNENKNSIKKLDNGYLLEMPSEISNKIEERKNVQLTLSHQKEGNMSIQGDLKRVDDGLLFETQDELSVLLDKSDFGIVLHDPNTSAASCGLAQFGIGCFYANPCAGTVYCLPGHGSNGFSCTCL